MIALHFASTNLHMLFRGYAIFARTRELRPMGVAEKADINGVYKIAACTMSCGSPLSGDDHRTLSLSNQTYDIMLPYQLTATGYNLNYLPEYIALRHGFFREQGLDVTVKIPAPWDGVLTELAEDRADLALGGAWVPSMYRNRVQQYTIFGQIANRCPLAIIRRTAASSRPFKPADLVAKTVLMKSIGGASVGLFMKMFLQENGVDFREVNYVQDLDGKMLGDLFQGGMGDYFVTDNLTARIMAARNPDVRIALECVTQGEVPWSVYYQESSKVTPASLAAQTKFFTGLRKGIEWVLAHEAEEFRDELAELFPNAPIAVVLQLTDSFRANGMWRSTVIPTAAFDRWQRGLTVAHLLDEPLAYSTMVDDRQAMITQHMVLKHSLVEKHFVTNGDIDHKV